MAQKNEFVLNSMPVHVTTLAKRFLLKTVIQIGLIVGFYLILTDVTQAYLHWLKPLKRDIFEKPCENV